jgi:hypothetical protein
MPMRPGDERPASGSPAVAATAASHFGSNGDEDVGSRDHAAARREQIVGDVGALTVTVIVSIAFRRLKATGSR